MPDQSQLPDSHTGLPLLKSWPALYAFVLITFLLIVAALTLFTRAFS